MSDTRQILESLIEHPGWAAFRAHVEHEWGIGGDRYLQELDKALDLTDPAMATNHARQIRAARRTIEMLMRWPAEELARLSRMESEPPATLSRGGYG